MGKTYTSTQGFVHKLHSKIAKTEEVLIRSNYDFLIQKYDLRLLLRKNKVVRLVPYTEDPEFLLNQSASPLLDEFKKNHLIIHSRHDKRNRVIYELIVLKNKSIIITTVFDFCESCHKKIYISADFYESNSRLSSIRTFMRRSLFHKRILVVAISAALFVISFPLWAVSYIFIKLQSLGTGSMRLDEEVNDPTVALKKNPRVFYYGRFIETSRVYDLVHIYNIFRLDLSLIGPHAERPVFTKHFDEAVPYYNVTHPLKPGLTGYTKVMYRYGSGVYDALYKLINDRFIHKKLERKIGDNHYTPDSFSNYWPILEIIGFNRIKQHSLLTVGLSS